jgi:hypothetical protein
MKLPGSTGTAGAVQDPNISAISALLSSKPFQIPVLFYGREK